MERMEGGAGALEDAQRLEKLCKLNVIEQMAHLHTHPVVEERFRQGKVAIHGWYYEIHTGRIEAYSRETGAFEDWPPL